MSCPSWRPWDISVSCHLAWQLLLFVQNCSSWLLHANHSLVTYFQNLPYLALALEGAFYVTLCHFWFIASHFLHLHSAQCRCVKRVTLVFTRQLKTTHTTPHSSQNWYLTKLNTAEWLIPQPPFLHLIHLIPTLSRPLISWFSHVAKRFSWVVLVVGFVSGTAGSG